MKKGLILLCLLFLFNVSIVMSAEPTLQVSNVVKKQTIQYAHLYLKYYKIEKENMIMSFVPLSKTEIKQVSKLEKIRYKEYKKIDNYLRKQNYFKAYNQNPDYLPTLIALYNYYNVKKQYTDVVKALEKIEKIDQYDLFNKDMLNSKLAMAYFDDKDYHNAIKKFVSIQAKTNDIKIKQSSAYFLGVSYFNIKDYNNAIKYMSLIPDGFDKREILFLSYYNLGNKTKAHQIANQALNIEPSNFVYLLRAADTSTNKGVKLNYYYKAKKYASDDSEKYIANKYIVLLEDEKIRNACKNIKGFVSIPQWAKIQKEDINLMTFSQEMERQNDFYKYARSCSSKYFGNDLKDCLNNLNIKQEKITQKLIIEQQERNRQIAELEKIRQMQMLNYNIIQQNNLIRQQNYELSRPKYYNSTISPVGNTYYINSYSY